MIITAAIFYLVMGGIGDYIWTFLGIATAVDPDHAAGVPVFARDLSLHLRQVQRRAFASMRLGFLSYLGMRTNVMLRFFEPWLQALDEVLRKCKRRPDPAEAFYKSDARSILFAWRRWVVSVGACWIKRRSIRCTTVSSSSKTSSARWTMPKRCLNRSAGSKGWRSSPPRVTENHKQELKQLALILEQDGWWSGKRSARYATWWPCMWWKKMVSSGIVWVNSSPVNWKRQRSSTAMGAESSPARRRAARVAPQAALVQHLRGGLAGTLAFGESPGSRRTAEEVL